MILKEAGGRFENAAGAIDNKSNMFAGSSGNAVSDKLGGGESNNPIAQQEETQEETPAETPTETTTPEVTEESGNMGDEQSFSDGNLKDTYNSYKTGSSTLKGKTKNLDLDPMSSKPSTSGAKVGGGMSSMFKGIMGADSGSGTEGAGDVGADAGDMADAGDAADAASDTRLKNIFGDNEDIIKTFAKINAIEFTYNDKAKEIPGSENKGVDDDVHFGIKAQELAENPLTASAVSKDPNSGYLQVDTKELTTTNSAVISEICKRLEIIEKVLGIKVVQND